MLVYKIIQEPTSDLNSRVIPGMELISVEFEEFRDKEVLTLENEFMHRKYGFRISRYECDSFITHHTIWKRFWQTEEPYCLVMENTAHFSSPPEGNIRNITKLIEDDLDWDILFPFEPKDTNKQVGFDPQYLLGYYWKSAAYFVTRKGVEKLLSINQIRQPVVEEMLTLSFDDQLEVLCSEMDFFTYTEDLIQKKHRNESKRNEVFESSAWTPKNRKKATEIIQLISGLAAENSIDLILCDGSLLGQVRHGGIMPWDDDIDLALEYSQFEQLKTIIESEGTLMAGRFQWGKEKITYAKIWSEDGENIPGFQYKFPFVDIWFYKEEKDSIIFNTGTIYPKKLYKPFTNILFEGSQFKIPFNPIGCLDLNYSHWKTQIVVYPWSHRLEQAVIKPLIVDISVDQNGRMI